IMAVSYKKLFKLMIDRNMNGADLRRAANISPNTLTKLYKNDYVALEVLDRICTALDVDYSDILEHVKVGDIQD
ncbi:MAG: helix-turn-helix domain-containing protein, partial [Phascolarctobacterium sp.]